MDRTGWIAVSACMLMMFVWYAYVLPKMTPPAPEPLPGEGGVPGLVEGDPTVPGPGPADSGTPAAAAVLADPGQTFELKSDETVFRIASRGGGIASATLLEHAESLGSEERIVLNQPNRLQGQANAIGAIGSRPGEFDDVVYSGVEIPGGVTLTGKHADGLQIEKRFTLGLADSEVDGKKKGSRTDPGEHLMGLRVKLTNTGDQPLPLQRYSLYGGAITATQPRGQLDTGVFWKEGSLAFKRVDWFKKFMLRPERQTFSRDVSHLDWAGVKSEYLSIIIRQLDHHEGRIWSRRFPTILTGYEEQSERMRAHGIECSLGFPGEEILPGETRVFDYEIFMGPKEYALLANLPDGQKAVMSYDKVPVMGPLFGWIIRPIAQLLVRLMVMFDGWFGNFGVAVILLTIVVRVVMWPLHAKAHATSKQMAQLTPKLTELKEKYEDDPQKMQQEQMKMWGEYGINPMGGCLPAFVQMPIFIAYFRMLASAVELRQEPFVLWLKDLSMPDTIVTIGGFDLNLLPILMAGTSYLQFAMMPKTGDKNQRMMFMMFPLMFLFFCYNYASALALYWTCSNVISIGQTYILNKRPVKPLVKRKKGKRGSWMEKLQAQAEAAQKGQATAGKGGGGSGGGSSRPSPLAAAAASGGGNGGGSTNFGEKGPRKQKPKSKGAKSKARNRKKRRR